jgi:magnesium transporter
MPRFLKIRTASKGTAPGSLIFIGQKKQEQVRIRVMSYDKDNLEEAECKTLEEAYKYLDPSRMTWINVDGLHDPEIISNFGARFDISPLVLEDIMNTDHRPKYEEHGDQIYITAKLLTFDMDKKSIESEQISLLVGDHYVVSFQERVGIHFESLRERIRQARVRLRSIDPDYVTFALIDLIVDGYIEIIGKIGEEVEFLEEEVLKNPRRTTAEEIYRHRIEMNYLRRIIRPVKEIISDVLKSDLKLFQEKNRSFYRDLDDHVMTALDAVESYQSMILEQFNMYSIGISNRANDIMKVLTIFASIFIPLSFVAGVYGMNFSFIPELSWKYGYLYFWGLIVLIISGLLVYFRRNNWF